MASRDEMNLALKTIVIPFLRSIGFKGALPHLRRMRGDACDLLSFQFRSAGGSFVVEVGRVSASGKQFAGRLVPVEKLNTTYLQFRHRLGAPPSGGDHWYQYDDESPDEVAHRVVSDLQDPALWSLVDSFELPASG